MGRASGRNARFRSRKSKSTLGRFLVTRGHREMMGFLF